jgi:phage I-like protein
MKKHMVALNTLEIGGTPGAAPEWVKLLPAGPVIGRDGRSWNNSLPLDVLGSFADLARDLPIDIEHSTELKAPKGEPAPAVGWIRELDIRDGEIWGRAAWNSAGKQLVEEKSYRYLSPVIVYEPASGNIAGVISVGLTNQPNLKLPALNSEQGAMKSNQPTNKEEGMLKAILAALALGENATQEEALAKIKELQGEVATAANRAASPSLEKFVPRADYDTALARATNAEQAIGTIKKEQSETAINTAIEQALKDGKITPATVDYHKAQCRNENGLAMFTEFCRAAPAIGGASGLDGKNPKDGNQAVKDPVEIALLAAEYKELRARAGTTISVTEAVAHIMKTGR